MRAFQSLGLSVELELTGIEFTTHETMREKWGIPTVNAFLTGNASAHAAEYALRFSSHRPRLGSLGGHARTKIPSPFRSDAEVESALRTWGL